MAPEINTSFGPGDWAIIDDEDDSRAIVVETSDVPAADYTVPGTDRSVAEYTDCDPDDSIITVVYVESLNSNWPTWSVDDVLDRKSAGTLHESVRTYAFPTGRLELLHEHSKD